MTLRVASEPIVTVAQVRAHPNCGCIGTNSPADAVVQALIDMASDMIHHVTAGAISGRQTVKARPCRLADREPCDCCGSDVIPLGDADPQNIVVKINGATLTAPELWKHWNGWTWVLGRRSVDGLDLRAWPSTQKRWREDTQDDTFSVTWTHGVHLDQHIIAAAGLEVVCDLASDDHVMANLLDGAASARLLDLQVTIDPNRLNEANDTRLNRIANGELGPMTRRMMGILAPSGRRASMVWAPELMLGWQMNLKLA